jgi:hypothetical protein
MPDRFNNQLEQFATKHPPSVAITINPITDVLEAA